MLTLNLKYLYLTILLFFIEVGIAIFIDDRFIRPLVGDILVVILIYCFIKAFWKIRPQVAALAVLLFAYLIEGLQYFKLVNHLGLQDNKLAVTVLGSTFDWKDLVAYAIGTVIILWLENRAAKTRLDDKPYP